MAHVETVAHFARAARTPAVRRSEWPRRRAHVLNRIAAALRFASSYFAEVRPSILISKYKNFLTGLVRLLELVIT